MNHLVWKQLSTPATSVGNSRTKGSMHRSAPTSARFIHGVWIGLSAVVNGRGRWRRPPVVAAEEEASPTTTSRRPKWTSVSAARWLWAAESWAKWTGAVVVGGGGPARRWAGDGGSPRGRATEVLLVGGLVGDARPARGCYRSCSRR